MGFDSLVRIKQTNKPEFSGYIVDVLLQYLKTGIVTGIALNTGQLTGQFYPLSSNPLSYVTQTQLSNYPTSLQLSGNNATVYSLVDANYYPRTNPNGYISSSGASGFMAKSGASYTSSDVAGFVLYDSTHSGRFIEYLPGSTWRIKTFTGDAIIDFAPVSYPRPVITGFDIWTNSINGASVLTPAQMSGQFLRLAYADTGQNLSLGHWYLNTLASSGTPSSFFFSPTGFSLVGYHNSFPSEQYAIDLQGTTYSTYGLSSDRPFIYGFDIYGGAIKSSGFAVLTSNDLTGLASKNDLAGASGALHDADSYILAQTLNYITGTGLQITGVGGITVYKSGAVTVISGQTTGSFVADTTFVRTTGAQNIFGSKVFYDNLSMGAMSINSRLLYDSHGLSSVNWGTSQLVDTNGLASVQWNNRRLRDLDSVAVLDWASGWLSNGQGIAVDWNRHILSGRWNINGDLTISGFKALTGAYLLAFGTQRYTGNLDIVSGTLKISGNAVTTGGPYYPRSSNPDGFVNYTGAKYLSDEFDPTYFSRYSGLVSPYVQNILIYPSTSTGVVSIPTMRFVVYVQGIKTGIGGPSGIRTVYSDFINSGYLDYTSSSANDVAISWNTIPNYTSGKYIVSVATQIYGGGAPAGPWGSGGWYLTTNNFAAFSQFSGSLISGSTGRFPLGAIGNYISWTGNIVQTLQAAGNTLTGNVILSGAGGVSFSTVGNTIVISGNTGQSLATGQFITTSQTGQFAPSGLTGQFISTAQTGQFAPSGMTGQFITTDKTGVFVVRGETGNAFYPRFGNPSNFLTSAGTTATTINVTGIIVSGALAVTGINGLSVQLSGQTIVISGANTGGFVSISQTGQFVDSSKTGGFVSISQTGNFVDNAHTGGFVSISQTGQFITTAQTGQFAPSGMTGQFVTTDKTGQFAPSGMTGQFLTTAQTGIFVPRGETGNAFYPRFGNPAGFLTSAGTAATTITVGSSTISGGITFTGLNGEVVILSGQTIFFSGANTGGLVSISQTGQFITTAQTGQFAPSGMTGQFVTTDKTGQYAPAGLTGQFVTTAMTGNFITTGERRNLIFGNFTQVSGLVQSIDKMQYYPNVATFISTDNTTGALILNTPLRRDGFYMVAIRVHGYRYSTVERVDFTSVGYVYAFQNGNIDGLSGGFQNTSVVDIGDDSLSKYIGVNSSGNIAVALGDTNTISYFSRFSADVWVTSSFNQNIPTFPTGWSWSLATGANFAWGDKNILTGSIVKSFMTGQLVDSSKTGQFVVKANTGQFITTAQTGQFAPSGMTGQFITTSMTGQFAPSGLTGQFITTAQTGQYAPAGMTGQFITTFQTGQFAPSGMTGQFVTTAQTGQYAPAGLTGQFITTAQTGQYAPAGMTGQFVDSSKTGQFLDTSDTGFFVTTGERRNVIFSNFTQLSGIAQNMGQVQFYPNVATILVPDDTTGSFIFHTPYPRSLDHMFAIRVHGYRYGSAERIDSTIVAYNYPFQSGNIDNGPGGIQLPALSDIGTDTLSKFVGIDSSGNIAVAIGNTGDLSYFPRISADIWITRANGSNTITRQTGWSWSLETGLNFQWLDRQALTGTIVKSAQTGQFVVKGNTGQFITTAQTGQYAPAGMTGQFVTTNKTGQFAPSGMTGQFITTAQTGQFVWTGYTGGFYPTTNPQGYITSAQVSGLNGVTTVQFLSGAILVTGYGNVTVFTGTPNLLVISGVTGNLVFQGMTGQFVDSSKTGQYITTALTGQFAPAGMTGQFITTAQTGQFAPSGMTGQFITTAQTGQYAPAGMTGQFVTTDKTGQFVTSAMTGQFLDSSDTGQYVTTAMTGYRWSSLRSSSHARGSGELNVQNWYRVAQTTVTGANLGRFASWLNICGEGTTSAPVPRVFYISRDWLSNVAITLVQQGYTVNMTGLRVVDDTGIHQSSIDILVNTNTSGLNWHVTAYNDDSIGTTGANIVALPFNLITGLGANEVQITSMNMANNTIASWVTNTQTVKFDSTNGISYNNIAVVLANQTGQFITTAQTGIFLTASSISQFVTTSQTGQFITTAMTGQFVTAGLTGQFVTSDLTGQFITTAQTGQYAPAGMTGQFVTTNKTGQFVDSSKTGQFLDSSDTGTFLTAGQTGLLANSFAEKFETETVFFPGLSFGSVQGDSSFGAWGGFLSNGLSNWSRRGGNVSTVVSGAVTSITNPDFALQYPFNDTAPYRNYAQVNRDTTGIGAFTITATGIAIPTASNNNWYPFVTLRLGASQSPQISFMSMDYYDNSGLWVNGFSGVPSFKGTMWIGTQTTVPNFPVRGARFSFTITGNALPFYVSEIGVNNLNYARGASTLAYQYDTNVFGNTLISGTLSGTSVVVGGFSVVTTNLTGQYAPAGLTGQFITTAQTGQYAPAGLTGQFITTAQTGQYAPAGMTGQFITTAQTGIFYSASNPNGYINIANGDARYYLTTNPSSYVTASQTGNLTNAFYPLNTNPSNYVITSTLNNYVQTSQTGNFISNGQTGVLSNSFYPLNSNPSSYVTASQTGGYNNSFYPLNSNPSNYVTSSQTGQYVTTAMTGTLVPAGLTGNAFYPRFGNPAGYITSAGTASTTLTVGSATISGNITFAVTNGENIGINGQTITFSGQNTGGLVSISQTGNFVDNAHTGGFVSISQTGQFVDSSKTGQFVVNAQLGVYALTSATGQFISTAQTGIFVARGETGNAFYPRFGNPAGYITSAGGNTSIQVGASTISGAIVFSAVSGEGITLAGQTISFGGKDTGLLANSFYPLNGNPAGYLTSASVTFGSVNMNTGTLKGVMTLGVIQGVYSFVDINWGLGSTFQYICTGSGYGPNPLRSPKIFFIHTGVVPGKTITCSFLNTGVTFFPTNGEPAFSGEKNFYSGVVWDASFTSPTWDGLENSTTSESHSDVYEFSCIGKTIYGRKILSNGFLPGVVTL